MKWKVHTNHRGRMSLAWAIKNRQTKPQQQRYFGRGFGEKKKKKRASSSKYSSERSSDTFAFDSCISEIYEIGSKVYTRFARGTRADETNAGKREKKRKRNGTERNGLLKKRCICSKKGKWLAQVVAFPNLTVRISYIVKYRPRCNRW